MIITELNPHAEKLYASSQGQPSTHRPEILFQLKFNTKCESHGLIQYRGNHKLSSIGDVPEV